MAEGIIKEVSRPRRPREFLKWLTVINTLSVDIPPYSFVGILDVDLDGTHYVGYPQSDGDKLVLITYEFTIKANSYSGEATNDYPWWVEYNVADGTPTRGQRWGPKQNEFKARKDKEGFLAIPMQDGAAPPYATDHKLVYLGLEYCRP